MQPQATQGEISIHRPIKINVHTPTQRQGPRSRPAQRMCGCGAATGKDPFEYTAAKAGTHGSAGAPCHPVSSHRVPQPLRSTRKLPVPAHTHTPEQIERTSGL